MVVVRVDPCAPAMDFRGLGRKARESSSGARILDAVGPFGALAGLEALTTSQTPARYWNVPPKRTTAPP